MFPKHHSIQYLWYSHFITIVIIISYNQPKLLMLSCCNGQVVRKVYFLRRPWILQMTCFQNFGTRVSLSLTKHSLCNLKHLFLSGLVFFQTLCIRDHKITSFCRVGTSSHSVARFLCSSLPCCVCWHSGIFVHIMMTSILVPRFGPASISIVHGNYDALWAVIFLIC